MRRDSSNHTLIGYTKELSRWGKPSVAYYCLTRDEEVQCGQEEFTLKWGESTRKGEEERPYFPFLCGAIGRGTPAHAKSCDKHPIGLETVCFPR